MNGDTPEFRALLRRLRRQADDETDSYVGELAAACASAAESYERCLQRLLHLIDARRERTARRVTRASIASGSESHQGRLGGRSHNDAALQTYQEQTERAADDL